MDWSVKLQEARKNELASEEMIGADELMKLSLFATACGLLVFLVFWYWPGLDISISSSFYSSKDGFFMNADQFVVWTRKLLLYAMVGFYVFAVIFWIHAYNTQRAVLGFSWDKWFYLCMGALAGPIFIVNMVLKAYWGRARPRDTDIFGGPLQYSDFWVWSDQCLSNCSFTSGEVAGVAMILFSIAFLLGGPARYIVIGLGILGAGFAGWLRIVMGAHYTSDTVMASLLMLLVAAELYFLIFLRPNQWLIALNEKQSAKLGK